MRKKIAFLILAHDDPVELSRLFRALGSYDDIYVHIDQRANLSTFENQDIPSNVRFTKTRFPVFWAHISLVEATLILLQEAMRSQTEYLRLVLLSGSCYPIKPIAALRNYFTQTEDHIDIRYTNIREYADELKHVISSYHFRRSWIPAHRNTNEVNRYWDLFDRGIRKAASIVLKPIDRGFYRTFPGLVPYIGSQFWSITPECANAVLQFVGKNPQFLQYHKYSFAPDEHFFHTIIGNSDFAAKTDGLVPLAGGTNVNNLHTPRYAVLTIDHLDSVLASDRFFVRKAVTGKSDLLLDYLDEKILSS
jgi:hypothetical protein